MATPAEAALEILRRRKARDSLLSFCEYTHPEWDTGPHHTIICSALERLERGECKRLIIQAPPRHGKSETASRRFPAWFLGRHPKAQIIFATYSEDFASDFGRDVQDILATKQYQGTFDTRLARADQSLTNWRTKQGGIFIAAGAGGQITGRGADLFIIDDPIKNRKEADSARVREGIHDWYLSAARTRLQPGGRIILMMTRWHEEDLAGKLLKYHKEDDWELITLPGISEDEDGEEHALWPSRFPLKEMQKTRKLYMQSSPREWWSLFQQSPRAEEGTYIQRGWFANTRWRSMPDIPLNIYMASDFAVTETRRGAHPDWTEHGVFGVGRGSDGGERMYVLDWWSGRTTSDVWIDKLLDLVKKWKPLAWFGEKGTIYNAVRPMLEKRMRERSVYFRRELLVSSRDKAVRGRAFQGVAHSQRVWFPRTIWAEQVIEQCVGFPGATFDDKFDVMSFMCLAIDEAHPAVVRRAGRSREKNTQDSYRSLTETDSQGWKVV